jgi:hypothetical protein
LTTSGTPAGNKPPAGNEPPRKGGGRGCGEGPRGRESRRPGCWGSTQAGLACERREAPLLVASMRPWGSRRPRKRRRRERVTGEEGEEAHGEQVDGTETRAHS